MASRRRFLTTTTIALLGSRAHAQRACRATGADIEGPFFRPGAPADADLREDTRGTPLVLRGCVMDRRCQPVPGAVVELWHADPAGDYDLEGFRFRTRLTTNEDGRWRVSTIVPGRYLNGARYRPAHVHAKVHVTGRPTLTTQLYFPNDPYNDGDPWFDASRLVSLRSGVARFDFVV